MKTLRFSMVSPFVVGGAGALVGPTVSVIVAVVVTVCLVGGNVTLTVRVGPGIVLVTVRYTVGAETVVVMVGPGTVRGGGGGKVTVAPGKVTVGPGMQIKGSTQRFSACAVDSPIINIRVVNKERQTNLTFIYSTICRF